MRLRFHKDNEKNQNQKKKTKKRKPFFFKLEQVVISDMNVESIHGFCGNTLFVTKQTTTTTTPTILKANDLICNFNLPSVRLHKEYYSSCVCAFV